MTEISIGVIYVIKGRKKKQKQRCHACMIRIFQENFNASYNLNDLNDMKI